MVFPAVLFSSQENPRSGDKAASGGTWVLAPSVVNFKETVESLMAFHLLTLHLLCLTNRCGLQQTVEMRRRGEGEEGEREKYQ